MIVGFDLDGVIGDQVTDVLPRIRERLGINLTYDDITEFRLPLGQSDLSHEIELAQQDESYILGMQPYTGAAATVAALRKRFRLVLITARPATSRGLTEQWLRANGFEFDELVNARESKKSVYGADVLVDDYIGNIEDFVEHSDGLGILLMRPWNRRHDALSKQIEAKRVVVARDLREVAVLVETFAAVRERRTSFSPNR